MDRNLAKYSNLIPGKHTPQPHPSAPQDVKASFQSFLEKIDQSRHAKGTETTASQTSAPGLVDFWDAPAYLTHTRPLEEAEIEAIQVSTISFIHNLMSPDNEDPLNRAVVLRND